MTSRRRFTAKPFALSSLALAIAAAGCTQPPDAESAAQGEVTAREPLVAAHASVPPLEQPSLVVVHASTEFDVDATAKAGIDRLVASFADKKLPTVYLVSDTTPAGEAKWYTASRRPDYLVYSAGGEHNLPLVAPEVTLVGGFFGTADDRRGCYATALRNVVTSYFYWQKRSAPLTIHMPVAAIYFWQQDEFARTTFLRHGDPAKFVASIRSLLFSSEFSDDGGPELGVPYLRTFRVDTVPNPFADPSTPAAPSAPSADSPRKDPKTGFLETEDGRYIEGPGPDAKTYTFEIRAMGHTIESLGSGSSRVILSFE